MRGLLTRALVFSCCILTTQVALRGAAAWEIDPDLVGQVAPGSAAMHRTNRAEARPAPSQCVVCHEDEPRLKALTPPDPPMTAEGEG